MRHFRIRKLVAASGLVFSATAFALSAGAADGERGKQLFERRCSGCHAVDKDKEGPRLRGVYGRPSGTVASFEYSDALKASHILWDAGTLAQWLADPEKLVPGNNMSFQLTNADERTEIIAYLKQLSAK